MKAFSRDRLGEAGILRRRQAASGAAPRPAPIEPRRWRGRLLLLLLPLFVLVLRFLEVLPEEGGAPAPDRPYASPPPASAPEVSVPPAPWEEPPAGCPDGCAQPPPGCGIKGNVSLRTGERIYHLPGQRYYEDTVIEPGRGERWFCAESEARANGWRKSLR